MTPIPTERLEEMLRGTEGVTPGVWDVIASTRGDWPSLYVRSPDDRIVAQVLQGVIAERFKLNAAHIARCDPDTIRSLITEVLSSRRADTAEAAEVVKPSDIPDLLDRYWALAYAEGKEGRDHDTVNGDAQEVRTKLSLAFIGSVASLSSQVEGLKVERDEAAKDFGDFLLKAAAEGLRLEGPDPNGNLVPINWRAEKAEAALASQAIPEGFVLAPKDGLAEALRNAVLSCGHSIDSEQIILLRSDKMQGNALNQLGQRIAAALTAIPAAPEVNK